MYRSSGAYHNSRAAGYTAGSGRSNDYSAKPVSSTSSVYSYKPSSSSIQPGTSATASLTGSRSPSASYITTGANRSSGELSSVNRDADPSRWLSGSGRTYDSIRSADLSGKPVVYSLSNTSQPSAATYTGSSTRPVTSTVRPAGSYGSVRASVSSQPTESSVRLKTQPIYTSSYSLKPFTVNSTATSGGSAHFSTPAGTGSTSVRDTFSARGTPRTIVSYASERVSEANQPTREPRTSSYTVPARTYVNTRPTESRSASYHSSYPTSSSRPITTSSRPIPSYDQPVMSSSQPETSSSRPITSPSRPITSYTRPVTSSSRPITSSSQPVTSSTRVVSSTTLTGARNVSSADGNARDEAERVRCGRLGEGVSGRAIVISDREFRNNNKALTTSNHQKHAEQLTTKNIDLHKDENRSNHYTDKYEHTNLIVRRGQDFDVTVIFNRPYDASKDTVTLQFAVGYRPQESKGTIIRVPVSLTRDYVYGAWSAKIMQTTQESVRLQITSPADAVVGRCHFYVETKTSVPGVEKETDFRYQHPEEIIMLFNPWCKDDTVYLDQQTSREEYVLNDSGLIWMGTAKRNRGMPWNFGQFEDVSLNTCLWLLERGQLGTAARANPVRVTRCISAMANFNDQDGGVLFGRWDNDYPKDTTAPTAWSGSVAILEKFWQKKIVVKFAQCWVFSGLVTTLLRAIGIPTRSVTNFASAHDSDASMTVDFHFDEKGKPLKDMDDSVWNFHVWNESWFKRPDLPDGHDGWQAHDATPQETSFGVFRCGPASVKAIKQGEVYLPFDSSFVFAEVNGDRVFWEVGENGSMKVIRIDKKCIGKMISTKAVGSDDRDDVTHQYKHPEGSVQERRAVEMAYKYSSRKDQAIYGLPTEDVKFSFEMPDDVPIGKDVSVSLKMKNTTYKSRTVGGKITAMIGFYTGISCEDLKEEDFEITLDPWEERSFVVDIPAALYLDKCKADGGLKIYVKATVKESEQRFASYDTIDFQKPHINMEITRGEARVGQDFEVKVSFVNPLPVRISGGKWYIETSGANPKSKEIPNSAIVPEGKEAQATFKLTPYRVGVCRVSVTFRADMLSGVYGMSGVRVRE